MMMKRRICQPIQLFWNSHHDLLCGYQQREVKRKGEHCLEWGASFGRERDRGSCHTHMDTFVHIGVRIVGASLVGIRIVGNFPYAKMS